MIKAGAIDKGMFLLIKDAPYLVVDREFVSPGKGSAFVRLKLKNMKDGSGLATVMKTNDNADDVNVLFVDSQFMYSDAESFHFMNAENYDQFEVPKAGLEAKGDYMKEGETYQVVMWEDLALDIKLPMKMVFEVTEAAEALKGDTVTGATKVVKVETGLNVKVPLFIKQGEKIRVNTETGDYVERVND